MARKKAADQSRSPLMKLPAELRLHIYELALGGNTILVSDPADPHSLETAVWGYWLLCSDQGCRGLPAGLLTALDVAQWRRARRLNSMLRVCQQVYNEAKLVPYSSNSFAVTDRYELQGFLRYRTPEQERAIASITLYEVEAAQTWQAPLPDHIVAPLSGLQYLTLIVMLEKSNHKYRTYRTVDLSMPEARKLIFQGVKGLVRGNLRSLTVHIDATFMDFHRTRSVSGLPFKVPNIDEIRQWEKEIKQSIMS